MTVVILILLLIVAVAQVLFAMALSWLIRSLMEDRQDHAKCTAHLTKFVGDEWAAHVLEEAARDYDTMDGQAEVARIVNTLWTDSNGESVPSLWLRLRADSIRGYTVDKDEEVDS